MSGYQSDVAPGGLIGNLPLGQSLGGYAVAGGSGSYVAVLDPPITSYQAGMLMELKFDSTNLGPVQLNVDGLGLRDVKKIAGKTPIDLEANEIDTDLAYLLLYNGTYFQVINACCYTPTDELIHIDNVTGSLVDGTDEQVLGGPYTFIADQIINNPAFEIRINGALQFGSVKTIRVRLGSEILFSDASNDTGDFSLVLSALKTAANTLKVSGKLVGLANVPVSVRNIVTGVMDFSAPLNLTFTGQVDAPSVDAIVKEQFIVKGGRK